jgi:hypothetical protein
LFFGLFVGFCFFFVPCFVCSFVCLFVRSFVLLAGWFVFGVPCVGVLARLFVCLAVLCPLYAPAGVPRVSCSTASADFI